jgi:hypothetical protein
MARAPNPDGQAAQAKQGTVRKLEDPTAGQISVPESLIPVSQLAPLVEAHVGQIKAQLKSELERDIAKLPTRIEFFGAIITGLVIAFGIFWGMADRIEHFVDRSSTITEKLTKVEDQGEDNTKILEKISREQSKPKTSAGKKPDN